MTVSTIEIKAIKEDEDAIIAQHFYQMWLDNNVPVDGIEPNWLELTIQFIEQARRELQYQAFVATVDAAIVGSASCQLFAGLYPHILKPEHRKYGYIWGVYVEPSYRNRGIAKQLTNQAVNYLKSLHCTRAILNASPSGKAVYSSLGFCETNGMWLDLN
jgi:ribosomal protein S18 acetylase RimI-like enzyme